MSSTKAVSDLITRAQNEFKGVSLATTDALDFANEIYQIVGNSDFYDWRVAAGTTFGTTLGTQDYANVPADFSALKGAWLNDDSAATNPMLPLKIKESLPKSTLRGVPDAISVENGNFRLWRVPLVTRSGSGQWAVVFEYWKRPKRLSATSDTFEFDDAYFEVATAGFNARVADFIEDPRAGQWGGRNPETNLFVGTGMWGKFAVLLNQMVEAENRASGEVVYAPMESLL